LVKTAGIDVVTTFPTKPVHLTYILQELDEIQYLYMLEAFSSRHRNYKERKISWKIETKYLENFVRCLISLRHFSEKDILHSLNVW